MNLTDQLIQWQADLSYLQGEIGLAIGALLLLSISLFKIHEDLQKGFFAALMLALLIFWPSQEVTLFNGFLVQTLWTGTLSKILIASSLLLIVFADDLEEKGAHYFLISLVLLGAIFLIQSRHLLLIYLSMELISYGSYILTNFSFKKKGHEAALKYLLFGGVSSAIMLFGISFLYGSSGSMVLSEIQITSPLGAMAFYLFLAGVFFKISLVPFQTWVPNVYQTSPVSTAAFFSIVPKLAGFGLLAVIINAWDYGHEVILTLGILTILIGTFGAVRQTNVRRLLSYGAIAHSGFILPLVVLDSSLSFFIWYALIYAIMNLAAFHFVSWFEKNGLYLVDDFAGFGKSNTLTASSFTGILISLVGIPPFAGFLAKWLVFLKLWENHLNTPDGDLLLFYLIISVLSTVVALFYYLKVPFSMFLKFSDGALSLRPKTLTKIIFVLWLALLVIGFLYPGLL